MPRSVAYYHLLRRWGLQPSEVDALDPQTLEDFFVIDHMKREIRPAQ